MTWNSSEQNHFANIFLFLLIYKIEICKAKYPRKKILFIAMPLSSHSLCASEMFNRYQILIYYFDGLKLNMCECIERIVSLRVF